jgi:hypothetical protein
MAAAGVAGEGLPAPALCRRRNDAAGALAGPLAAGGADGGALGVAEPLWGEGVKKSLDQFSGSGLSSPAASVAPSNV